MIWYKTQREDDPYNKLWAQDEWLYPVENAENISFPIIVTVEPTNVCTNKCLYCSRRLMDRKIGYMSLETMELIALEAGNFDAAIRHGGFGEPLLHPEIAEIVAICKKHGVLTTIFTNGTLLDEKMMRSFVESGLDEIRFSTSGIDPEVHNTYRKGSDYKKDFDEKLKMADDVRKELGSNKPYFTVFSNVIDLEDKNFVEKVDEYAAHYLQYADKIDIDLTMFSRVKGFEDVSQLYDRQKVKEVHKACVDLFLKVIVHWNGDVFACDKAYNREEDFYLGTIGKEGFTIADGFVSEKIKSLRKNVSFALNHEYYYLCKDCYSCTTKWYDASLLHDSNALS